MIFDAASSMLARSSAVSLIEAAPLFSVSLCNFVVPGIGMIHGFCASNQANAIWAVVAFLLSAIFPSKSINAWFALRASGVKRGIVLRMSTFSNFVFSSIFPVRNPLPRGLNGTKPILSSSSGELFAHLLQKDQSILLYLLLLNPLRYLQHLQLARSGQHDADTTDQ